MALYQGKTGYVEFAGKIMQAVTALVYDNGDIAWQNGSLWRFDENGLVDQNYVGATANAVIDKVFDADPHDPAKSAEWKMKLRRADVNRDMMDWNTNPILRSRLDDFLVDGICSDRIKMARVLTKTGAALK